MQVGRAKAIQVGSRAKIDFAVITEVHHLLTGAVVGQRQGSIQRDVIESIQANRALGVQGHHRLVFLGIKQQTKGTGEKTDFHITSNQGSADIGSRHQQQRLLAIGLTLHQQIAGKGQKSINAQFQSGTGKNVLFISGLEIDKAKCAKIHQALAGGVAVKFQITRQGQSGHAAETDFTKGIGGKNRFALILRNHHQQIAIADREHDVTGTHRTSDTLGCYNKGGSRLRLLQLNREIARKGKSSIQYQGQIRAAEEKPVVRGAEIDLTHRTAKIDYRNSGCIGKDFQIARQSHPGETCQRSAALGVGGVTAKTRTVFL